MGRAKMRVLIIGGTGLISTGITRLLLECGDEVTNYLITSQFTRKVDELTDALYRG